MSTTLKHAGRLTGEWGLLAAILKDHPLRDEIVIWMRNVGLLPPVEDTHLVSLHSNAQHLKDERSWRKA